MLYELDPNIRPAQPDRSGDPYLDAVGRANDAVLIAKSGRSESVQREAILRLADAIANTPGGVEQLRQIQDDQPETIIVNNIGSDDSSVVDQELTINGYTSEDQAVLRKAINGRNPWEY